MATPTTFYHYFNTISLFFYYGYYLSKRLEHAEITTILLLLFYYGYYPSKRLEHAEITTIPLQILLRLLPKKRSEHAEVIQL